MFDCDIYYEIGFYDAMNNFNSFYVHDLCFTIKSLGAFHCLIDFWFIDDCGKRVTIYSFCFKYIEYLSESLTIVIDIDNHPCLFENAKRALSNYLMKF